MSRGYHFRFLFYRVRAANFAATLAQYRENIRYAKDLTIELLFPDAENMSAAEYLKFERENLAEIRRALPKNEKIEWRETSIETDNQWLNEKLDNLENEAENSAKREQILTEIYERLDAIESENLKNSKTHPPKFGQKTKTSKNWRKFCGAKNFKNPKRKPKVCFKK